MTNRQKNNTFHVLWLFVGLIAGAVIGFFAAGYSTQNTSVSTTINLEKLTNQADNLLTSFTKLQSLNDKYATTISNKKNIDSSTNKTLDSLNNLLTLKQNNFAATLDSLQNNNSSYDKNSYILLLKITSAYKAALAQSNSLNSIRKSCTDKRKD